MTETKTEENKTAESSPEKSGTGKAKTSSGGEGKSRKAKRPAPKKDGGAAKKSTPGKKSPKPKAPAKSTKPAAEHKPGIDESTLSKGELRKLNALRKSLGDEIAEEAFTKWLAQQSTGSVASDPNIALIEEALAPLIEQIRMPRGTVYTISRGRGRFLVKLIDLGFGESLKTLG